jgi:ribonucleoside-diphosphate reductase alpha chain
MPNRVSSNGRLKICALLSEKSSSVYDAVEWEDRKVEIVDDKGKPIFSMENVESPKSWSALATDIVASKYFYGKAKSDRLEISVRELIHRVSRTIADWGMEDGYFSSTEDAEVFFQEISAICLNQYGSFNSPVWFNVGLGHVWGIKSDSRSSFSWSDKKKRVVSVKDGFESPQAAACFIQSVDDTMDDIMRLASSEAMLFKYGSGTGTDLSTIRSSREILSGGGTPSGPVSFMRVFDQIAAVIKSGGKTRRAAKMQSLKVSHPDIMEFIESKGREEKKAIALIEKGYDGSMNGEAYKSVMFQNANLSVRVSDDFMNAVENDEMWETKAVTTGKPVEQIKAREIMKRIAEMAHACGDPGVQYDTTINNWHTCKRSAPINASNPCVTGDARVATLSGNVRIDSLVGKSVVIIKGNGDSVLVDRVFKTGNKPVFELKTKAGYSLKLTGDHRVLTKNRGDVPAVNLTKDDEVILLGAGFGGDSISNEIGEVIGAAMGDGCIFNGDSQDFLGTSVSSVVSEIRKYCVLDEKSDGKIFLDPVFSLDKNGVSSILRSLFTADGTVANYGEKSQYIALDSTSLKMLRQVQLLLLSFGIKAKIYENRRPDGFSTSFLSDGKGGVKEYPIKQIHSLRISKDSRFKFEDQIGFIEGSEKNDQLKSLNSSVSAYTDRMTDRVKSLVFLGNEDVYDLTEPESNHFVANGVVVHNCSEFMFVDDSACNLTSLNLVKFFDSAGNFDEKLFSHAVRLFIIAQDILVDRASYPTRKIAANTHKFRPLGIGYANLGTLLMRLGLPYDSDKGRAIAGAITAIMTGYAYAASREIAGIKGAFAEWERNRKCMMDVLREHKSMLGQIDSGLCPVGMLECALKIWKDVVSKGEDVGFRNSQVSLLAPTGTIGLMMDCDTMGVEPDMSLVKYKKMSDNSKAKITNGSVGIALSRLGYEPGQVREIVAFVDKNETIEGSSVRPEHLPIFDCAFSAGFGKRFISHDAHLKMMAAVQPFLSGAISKTVNMAYETTVDDIMNVYMSGWRMGLKSVAIYRSGSKKSQPVNDRNAKGEGKGRSVRRRMPKTRRSITHKFRVKDHEGYLTVGLYEDGTPGELFVTMSKEGSTIGGMVDAFGIAISLCFQYGVPIGEMCNKFTHIRFEPSGFTGDPDIPIAKSIIDYIFRWIDMTFPDGVGKWSAASDTPNAGRKEQHSEGGCRSDAPSCGNCGAITFRNGTCYCCPNCGNTTGCS